MSGGAGTLSGSLGSMQRAKQLAPDLGPLAVAATAAIGRAAAATATTAEAAAAKSPYVFLTALDASLLYGLGKEGQAIKNGTCTY
jgi:hypothetical protein